MTSSLVKREKTPPRVQFSVQLNKIDCTDKYLLMEKMAFLSMPNIFCNEAHISWSDICFSVTEFLWF